MQCARPVPGLSRKKPSAVRSPVMNSRSRSSTSAVISLALSASVRASTKVGVPQTSAASRAAIRLRSWAAVGISTLPPMWPHFFSDASWSSKWTPAAPASIYAFMISKQFSGPPKPASASATIGTNQSLLAPPSACSIWSARWRVRLIRRHSSGAGVGRIEALVGIHRAGGVVVGGDLPARQIDRLQTGARLLHRLVAGDRAQRIDEGLFFSDSHSRLAPFSASV